MTFTCTIDMDNADFDDPTALGWILKRIALRTAEELDTNPRPDNRLGTFSVLDTNGNRVGSWKIDTTD